MKFNLFINCFIASILSLFAFFSFSLLVSNKVKIFQEEIRDLKKELISQNESLNTLSSFYSDTLNKEVSNLNFRIKTASLVPIYKPITPTYEPKIPTSDSIKPITEPIESDPELIVSSPSQITPTPSPIPTTPVTPSVPSSTHIKNIVLYPGRTKNFYSNDLSVIFSVSVVDISVNPRKATFIIKHIKDRIIERSTFTLFADQRKILSFYGYIFELHFKKLDQMDLNSSATGAIFTVQQIDK